MVYRVYQCQNCNKEIEAQENIQDLTPTIKQCPDCAGFVKRIITNVSFQLKGDRWSKDNYGLSEKK